MFIRSSAEFQSTHPRRVWLLNLLILLQGSSSFNPHTHEGCDKTNEINYKIMQVSIHTPTKGVTYIGRLRKWFKKVSIHTPTKGVTKDILIAVLSCLFQSTHPRRVWLLSVLSSPPIKTVSIHTPTKGVTLSGKHVSMRQIVSIHTPTKGVTYWVCIPIESNSGFNPHTHEGCDTELLRIPRLRLGFNPHTHEGCDWNEDAAHLYSCVSIHTPTKGVTAYSANSWISWCKDNYFAKDGKIITRKIL